MHDSKAALAGHPQARLGLDPGIVQDGSLVQQDASAVDGAGKGHLIWVKVVEGRFPFYLIRRVAQNVLDRVGGEQDVGIRGKVCQVS